MLNLTRFLGLALVLLWAAPPLSHAAHDFSLAAYSGQNPLAIPSPPRDDPNSVEGEDPPVDGGVTDPPAEGGGEVTSDPPAEDPPPEDPPA